MKYLKVEKIIVENDKGNFWVKVKFTNNTIWTPGFIELGKIINGICQCEDIKYPNGKGREMPKRFIKKCTQKEIGMDNIPQIYKDEFE